MSAASSTARYPWDVRATRASEAEVVEERGSDSEGSDVCDDVSAEDAGAFLVEFLMEMLTHRRPMSARSVCDLLVGRQGWSTRIGGKIWT